MKLQIKINLDMSAPRGTVVIRNDEWVTLGRKTTNGNFALLTCHVDDISNTDLLDEDEWCVFTKKELEAALKLRK